MASTGSRLRMPQPVKTLVHEYSWIHLSIGIFGNVSFFIGSVCFLERFPDVVKTAGIWLFIVGSFCMMVGSLGSLAANLIEPDRS